MTIILSQYKFDQKIFLAKFNIEMMALKPKNDNGKKKPTNILYYLKKKKLEKTGGPHCHGKYQATSLQLH